MEVLNSYHEEMIKMMNRKPFPAPPIEGTDLINPLQTALELSKSVAKLVHPIRPRWKATVSVIIEVFLDGEIPEVFEHAEIPRAR